MTTLLQRKLRRSERGLTLFEVLISIGIIAVMASLVYGAFDGMSRTREGLSRLDERYHQGRQAMSRIARELQSAFLSLHQPPLIANAISQTLFVGTNSNPFDRIDFCSFSHRRFGRDLHESDQNELSYFGSKDPEHPSKTDLARREQREIDLDAQHGGVVNVMAEDIMLFDVTYMDPITGEWSETWDTTQATGQPSRLPLQVKVMLNLKGGPGNTPIKMQTKVPIAIMTALNFGLPK